MDHMGRATLLISRKRALSRGAASVTSAFALSMLPQGRVLCRFCAVLRQAEKKDFAEEPEAFCIEVRKPHAQRTRPKVLSR